jgi:spore maturation protein SpmA
MIFVGVMLVRRVFVVFGALGCSGYIGHLAFDIFQDSWLFPITLTVLGLLVIYLGILWQKHEQGITDKARKILPVALRELLESK